MSERQRKLHKYFDRLCGYCAVSAIFSYVAAFIVPQYILFMPLLIIPHSVFVILTEIRMKKALYVVSQFLGVLMFAFIILRLPFDLAIGIVMLTFLFIIFMYAMISGSSEETPATRAGIFAIVLNVLAIALIFYFYGRPNGQIYRDYYAVLPVFLINLGITLVGRLFCKFYAGLDMVTHSLIWRQEKDNDADRAVSRMAKKSQKYAVLFICAAALIALAAAARHYPEDFIRDLFAGANQGVEETVDHAFTPVTGLHFLEDYDLDEVPFIFAETPEQEVPEFILIEEPAPPNYVWGVILLIAVILLPILASLAARRRKKSRVDEGDDEGLFEDGYTEKGKARTARRVLFSANNTIRAMFRRKVNEHRKRGLPVKNADTARVISDDISKTEDISELSRLYHVARYSGKNLTGGDVARARRRK